MVAAVTAGMQKMAAIAVAALKGLPMLVAGGNGVV